MSTYEIDDEIVVGLLDNLDLLPPRLAKGVEELREQVPVPTPTKIGAMVMTDAEFVGPAVFVRWALDSHTHSPWIVAGDHEQPYRTDEIGRIVKVLAEGVDQS